MKRRSLIFGVGSLAGGVGLSIASGAFERTQAERSVTVELAEGNDAYLELESIGVGERGIESGGRVVFEFSGANERDEQGEDLGIGKNSVYEFVSNSGVLRVDSTEEPEGLLRLMYSTKHYL